MKYFLQRQLKETAKGILSRISTKFCNPLSRDHTRELDCLETVYKTHQFQFNSLLINDIKTAVEIHYDDSSLFKVRSLANQKICLLPSGGICIDKTILCTGFRGQQAFNILGYLQAFIKKKKTISGTIICNWSQQFLTYGDFVLQLLPELCLVKSVISQQEWRDATFVFSKPPKFLINYLQALGCDEHQIIDSSQFFLMLHPTLRSCSEKRMRCGICVRLTSYFKSVETIC